MGRSKGWGLCVALCLCFMVVERVYVVAEYIGALNSASGLIVYGIRLCASVSLEGNIHI